MTNAIGERIKSLFSFCFRPGASTRGLSLAHDAHVRIHLGAFQAGVTEHPLDEADVRPVFQHQCCHTVAEDVTASGESHIGFTDVRM